MGGGSEMKITNRTSREVVAYGWWEQTAGNKVAGDPVTIGPGEMGDVTGPAIDHRADGRGGTIPVTIAIRGIRYKNVMLKSVKSC